MIDHMNDWKESEKAIAWLEKQQEGPLHPEFIFAESLDHALRLLEEYEGKARLVAGGLDVMSLIKSKISSPAALINLKTLDRLRYMAATAEGLQIGGLTRIKEIERSDLILRKMPMLAEAARLIGSPHIRNMATLAGNLCQETRCWYYRRTPDTGTSFDCHRKGKGGPCYAMNGENQYHAVMGYDACASACPSDMAVVLSAMGARVRTATTSGGRTIPVDTLYAELGPKLQNSEIITSILFPENGPGVKQRFLKFRVRKSIDMAIVSAAVSYKITEEKVREARIFLGGVSPAPYRCGRAEEMMLGQRVSPPLAEKIAEEAAADAHPLSKNGYKVQLIKALVRRAIEESC